MDKKTIPSILTLDPLRVCFLLMALLLLAGCGRGDSADTAVANDKQISISVSGAFALFPMMTVWTEAYSELHPNITFDVQAGGAGKGMTDMIARWM
jgi:phosphate transport system substrate-binding protein